MTPATFTARLVRQLRREGYAFSYSILRAFTARRWQEIREEPDVELWTLVFVESGHARKATDGDK
jgi:hypothetical protein